MSGGGAGVAPELLAIIVCPDCHGDLAVDDQAGELVCSTAGGCGYAYPVRDDIPILLIDEARKPD